MSFNKAKAMRNAERYLTQGKIQAAINEYRQIVEQDPRDINTLNMLGDLYAKSGNDGEAIKYYQAVAEYYNSQGFAKKAIAIYNKIHRIEPNSLEVSSKLADLYRTRGSYAEAKKHYESLAVQYETKGQRAEALAMWENIAELDPRNAEIYLKIAESYWHDKREDEASESFIKAGVRLAECGNHESAVTAFSRALEITPTDFSAVEGLVRSQITLGYPEEAAKALELRIENDPYDRGNNFLLVDCYYDMGDPAAAERIIVKMVERDPSNYKAFLELIDVYFKNDDLNSAVRVMSMIAEHMLVGGEHEALLVLIEEVLARNPEHIGALRLLARYHAWLKDEGELKIALERVAESARIVGADEDEVFALSQLSILAPHDSVVAARLEELGGSDAYDSSSHFQIKQTGEVPSFESYAVLSNTEDGSGAASRESANGDQEQTSGEPAETGFVIETFASESKDPGEDTLEAEIVSDDDGSLEVSEAEQPEFGTESQESIAENAGVEEGKLAEHTETSPSNEEKQAADPDPTQLSAADEMKLEEELESIRFYLEQGYHGLADKSLTEMEIEFGRRPELVELREALAGTEFERSAYGKTETEELAPTDADPETFEAADDSPGVQDGAEAAQIVQSEATTGELEQSVAETAGQFESGITDRATGSEVAESDNSDTEQAVSNDSEVNDESDDDALTNSFESLREELGFSESEGVDHDDFENHYQHAVAYQEMGLTEEAIREYQHAVNALSPEDGTKRFLNCCTLLGHCFMEKGMPNLGIVWFKKAFEAKDLSAEERNGISYELANAFESDGDFENAMEEFEKIYTVDVDFRDVGERIEQLSAKLPVTA